MAPPGTREREVTRSVGVDATVRKLAAADRGHVARVVPHPAPVSREAHSQELARRENRSANGLLVPLAALAPETRAVVSTGTGGNLIGVDHSEAAIDRLRAALVTSRLGVQMVGGLTGNVEIPRLTGSSQTGWVAENGVIGESDPTFDNVALTPRHVASLTSYSRNLLLQSSPQIESLMRSDLAAQIAEAIDKAVLDGGANANEPTGVNRQAGVTAIQTAGSGVVTEDDILAILAALEAENAAATGFAVSTGAASALRKLRDGQGRVLGTLKGVGASATMLELPAGITSLLPAFATGATAVLAGNWSDVLVGAWGSVEIVSNPYGDKYFERASVGVRAIATVDIAIRRPKSFAKLTVKA